MIANVPADSQQRNSASLNVRMTADQHTQLQEVADDLGVGLSTLGRLALQLGLEPARDQIASAQARADRGDA